MVASVVRSLQTPQLAPPPPFPPLPPHYTLYDTSLLTSRRFIDADVFLIRTSAPAGKISRPEVNSRWRPLVLNKLSLNYESNRLTYPTITSHLRTEAFRKVKAAPWNRRLRPQLKNLLWISQLEVASAVLPVSKTRWQPPWTAFKAQTWSRPLAEP